MHTLSILEPYAFDVPCASDLALYVATLGWLVGRDRWGYA